MRKQSNARTMVPCWLLLKCSGRTCSVCPAGRTTVADSWLYLKKIPRNIRVNVRTKL